MKKGLGKGLNALIAHTEIPSGGGTRADEEIFEVEISKVAPNPDQPRKHFEESQIEELAESVDAFGIIQPLVVKKNGDNYIIVAGERRWRAAQKAGLKRVPIIIREYSDMQTLEIALIENVQREDLNPIEEANCYKRLSDDFGLKQEEISKKVGKSRSHISNCIRLLKLDPKIQAYIINGQLTTGHAKAILAIDNKEIQNYFARQMVEDNLSVREAEEFVKKYGMPLTEEEKQRIMESGSEPSDKKTAEKKYINFQMELRGLLSTRVNIKDNKTGSGGGKIEINYFSEDDLSRIIEIIKTSRI
ncbi:MAG: ParB/RepB/Spo0J family partition protein [Defluviitaleaceae bacterium]|nr:ParB/RepB/Spo0J family partition protein [Defluviitaleaceae bacterium]